MSDNYAQQEKLYRIASQQAGYFTTAQAREAGISRRQLSYYVGTGRYERIRRGLYRLTLYPDTPNEDLFMAWLEAGPRAVISHDSALALYDLSDHLPAEVHLIVPRTASSRHDGLRLHTHELAAGDVTRYAGLPATTVERTIMDVAAAGLAEVLVRQAVRQALDRGLTTRARLAEAASRRGGRARRLVERFFSTEAP